MNMTSKKPSEIFEGENSSLRKSFDDASAHKTLVDEFRTKLESAIDTEIAREKMHGTANIKDGGRIMGETIFANWFENTLHSYATKQIEDYQRDHEQKHIAEAVQIARKGIADRFEIIPEPEDETEQEFHIRLGQNDIIAQIHALAYPEQKLPKEDEKIIEEFCTTYGADAPRVATRTLHDSDVIENWLRNILHTKNQQHQRELEKLTEELEFIAYEVSELGDKPWRLFNTLKKHAQKYRPDDTFAAEWAQKWQDSASNFFQTLKKRP